MLLAANRDMDFVSVSSDLTFTAGLAPQCTAIMTLDDHIPEHEETFTVQLTSTNISLAVIAQSEATVTITDTDRMSCTSEKHCRE